MIHHALSEAEIANLTRLHVVKNCDGCCHLHGVKKHSPTMQRDYIGQCDLYPAMENMVRCISYDPIVVSKRKYK